MDNKHRKQYIWLRQGILTLGVFLAIAGGRLLLLQHFSTELPQFDAWGVEGEGIYRPYFAGKLSFADFFAPCNEHRVALTRLLALVLLILNGLWDNRMQAVINALFYASTAALFFWLAVRHLAPVAALFWGMIIVLAFSLPYGWENALWGFQSQFYLMVALSILVIYLANPEGVITWPRLMLMVILQILNPFTTSSGAIAAAAVLGCSGCALLSKSKDQTSRNRLLVLAGLSAALFVFGIVAGHVAVPFNQFKATSIVDFCIVLAHVLSWPAAESGYWWLINWLPWGVLLAVYLAGAREDRSSHRFCVTLGIWVLLQSAAIAYSRNTIALISKYLDPIAIGIPVNFLALLLVHEVAGKRGKRAVLVLASVWLVVNMTAFTSLTRANIEGDLPAKQQIYAIQLYRTMGFLGSGNIDLLVPRGKHEIPDRDVERYAQRLTDPVLGRILPRSVNFYYQTTGRPAATLSKAADLLTRSALQLLIAGLVTIGAVVLHLCTKRYLKRDSSCRNQ